MYLHASVYIAPGLLVLAAIVMFMSITEHEKLKELDKLLI